MRCAEPTEIHRGPGGSTCSRKGWRQLRDAHSARRLAVWAVAIGPAQNNATHKATKQLMWRRDRPMLHFHGRFQAIGASGWRPDIALHVIGSRRPAGAAAQEPSHPALGLVQSRAAPARSMDMHAATQRSVAAAKQLGSAVRAAAAARRCRLPLPAPSGGAPRPAGMEQQRAAARLGRLLSSLTPRASSGQESVGAPAAAPPPSAVQAAAAAAAPAPPPLASGYRMPPKEIADIVDAPPEPLLSFSPDRTLVLQARSGWSAGGRRVQGAWMPCGMPLCAAAHVNAAIPCLTTARRLPVCPGCS